ncbi:MAG: PSD1 domain-containing protein [Verrucomicrobiales bacterium]|nr:PSD1 domain-containing protein [Verrucomicrobiales bacterium]
MRYLALAVALLAFHSARSATPPPPGTVQFNRDIRRILSDNCFACHGFDQTKRKAGLRLDIPEGALAPAKSGKAAIHAGDPEGSELWRRIISTDPDDVMPPPNSHKTLREDEKALLKAWIQQGAGYQRHWSFEPPVSPTLPPAQSPDHSNPIDRLIDARLKKDGLTATPEASPEILIRRLAFDLTGLPPTPGEVDAFLQDRRSGRYDRLVDRLLASPRYGEQMARHWLDVARYADTHGLHLDNERSMWPYRDWVVTAFNRNLPFDEFTLDQLAGDLRPQATTEQLVATGFNRNNVTTSEGGSIDAEFVFRYAVDRTATAVQTWMGLTAGCAVCHDHKFDPISTREFYSMYAFFHNAADPPMDGNIQLTPPILKLKTASDEARLADFDTRIAAAEVAIKTALASVTYSDPALANPKPEPRAVDNVWADDDLPAGWKVSASPGDTTQFVTNSPGGIFSGNRALRRKAAGLAQDVFEAGATPLEIPNNGKLYAHVLLDSADLPKTIMVQFRTSEWKHRAVWGDVEAIDWGAKGTTERARVADLPEPGRWVRLEFDAAKVGLQPGDKITGFALTQFGGTVLWDRVGVAGVSDPATDPTRSLAAWLLQQASRETPDAPENLRDAIKKTPADQRTEAQNRQLRDHFLSKVCADTRATFDPPLGAVASLRKQREEFDGAIPATLIWRDLEKPRESFVMERGAYDRPGARVTPGVPAAFPPLPPSTSSHPPTRLDFAQWLLRPEHPLTARVAVNRLWQQFFGIGLVKTSGDFGSQGEPPSNPELLDWLALHFRDTGWDIKSFVRLIVTSATYRRSSEVTHDLLQRDPENRLLARGPRFRLDAEQIRDNALFVSGLMVGDMGGKGVKPYQPPNIWEPVGFVGSNTRDYKQDSGPALYRRSLYTFFKRTAPAPFMSSFDAPNREQACPRRERSNTPLQALQLMNDVQHFEAARNLAQRMIREGGQDARHRLHFAFRTVLSRPPTDQELAVVLGALDQHLARYHSNPEAANRVISAGESKPDPALPPPELAAYTLAANLLLNLDETLTRN